MYNKIVTGSGDEDMDVGVAVAGGHYSADERGVGIVNLESAWSTGVTSPESIHSSPDT